MALAELTLRDFIERTAARTPVPGGGAAAAATVAHGAALARMVLQYTLGKPRYAAHEPANRAADERIARAIDAALRLADADAQGYERLNALFRLDKDDPARHAAWSAAVEGAIEPPLTLAALAAELAATIEPLHATTTVQLRSDLAIAAILTDAGARAAAWNVRVNLPLVEDATRRAALESTVAGHLDAVATACRELESACRG